MSQGAMNLNKKLNVMSDWSSPRKHGKLMIVCKQSKWACFVGDDNDEIENNVGFYGVGKTLREAVNICFKKFDSFVSEKANDALNKNALFLV